MDTTRPHLFGILAYLVSNLAAGIASFVVMITLIATGIGTAVVWVGVPLLAIALIVLRGAARLERRRVHLMLSTYIATPYRPRPDGSFLRGLIRRLREAATWRDLTYALLLFPIGIIEFVLMVAFWSVSLGALFLPVYYRWLPEGEWRAFDWDRPWLVVDSVWEALPWAAVGAVLLAITVALTRGLGTAHAHFARGLLSPTRAALRDITSEPVREPTRSAWTTMDDTMDLMAQHRSQG
jgi:hypothetical protein